MTFEIPPTAPQSLNYHEANRVVAVGLRWGWIKRPAKPAQEKAASDGGQNKINDNANITNSPRRVK